MIGDDGGHDDDGDDVELLILCYLRDFGNGWTGRIMDIGECRDAFTTEKEHESQSLSIEFCISDSPISFYYYRIPLLYNGGE